MHYTAELYKEPCGEWVLETGTRIILLKDKKDIEQRIGPVVYDFIHQILKTKKHAIITITD